MKPQSTLRCWQCDGSFLGGKDEVFCSAACAALYRAAVARANRRKVEPEEEMRKRARQFVRDEWRAGRIVKGTCMHAGDGVCGGEIQAHHHNGYAPERWLDVQWICRRHHAATEYVPERERRRRELNSRPLRPPNEIRTSIPEVSPAPVDNKKPAEAGKVSH